MSLYHMEQFVTFKVSRRTRGPDRYLSLVRKIDISARISIFTFTDVNLDYISCRCPGCDCGRPREEPYGLSEGNQVSWGLGA
jgi:hypothetical protein